MQIYGSAVTIEKDLKNWQKPTFVSAWYIFHIKTFIHIKLPDSYCCGTAQIKQKKQKSDC